MYLKLKKSLIYNWWVAEEDNVMGFINIFDKTSIKKNLLVVGYLTGTERELATSSNRVVKITEKGVITEKGSFYPFEQSNEVYLQYLIEANEEKCIVARSWKWISNNRIWANIIRENDHSIDLEIDFTPNHNSTGVVVSGYSEQLKTNVVIPPFREGEYCLKLKIPDEIKRRIYKGCFEVGKEDDYRAKLIKKIFKRKFKFPYSL